MLAKSVIQMLITDSLQWVDEDEQEEAEAVDE